MLSPCALNRALLERQLLLRRGKLSAAKAIERLRPRLLHFRDERGRELLDLPEAPRPDPDTPAPPRFLPEYDNALLSHADRTRIISEDHRKRLITRNGRSVGTVLVDGYVGGTWRISRERGGVTLNVQLFKRLPRTDAAALRAEGERLLAFAAPEDPAHRVKIGVA